MKKQITGIAALLLIFFACVKENDVSMDFKLTGANNKTIVRGTEIEMALKVFYLGGEKEDVTVSAQNFPSGITADLNHAKGEPDFELSAFINVDINMAPGNYPVTFIVESASGKKFTRDFTITVTDPANKFPVLTLAGSGNITIDLNSSWSEPGYMAIDPEDGDLTSQVVVTGTVNPDFAATYSLLYKVFDSDGDSAYKYRSVHVVNSNSYMQGLYNCTTAIQNGPTFTWTGNVSTSAIHNYEFVLSKISDCLGTLATPMQLSVIPSGTNSITIPTQIVYGTNPSAPNHCETAYHLITGSGTVSYTPPYTFVINYTDLYEDSNGLQHTFTKTDTYVKAP
jgi:hypothetical protein